MAQVFLTGNKNVYVSENLGRKIINWKETKMEKTMMVDLGGEGFMELGQVRGVKLEGTDPDHIQREEQNAHLAGLIEEWNEYLEQLRATSPDEKAHWMNRTFCQLLSAARLNKGRIDRDSEIYLKLYETTYPYFEQNPKEYHAPKEVYQQLIGMGELSYPKAVDGFKTIGQLIQTKKI